MSYDNPLRVVYQFEADPRAALTRNIPVPDGVNRFRVSHLSAEAIAFGDSTSSTNTIEFGTGADADAFGSESLTVSDSAPTAVVSDNQDAYEVGDNDEIVVTRSADGTAPVSKEVALFIVIDWF